MISPFTHPTYLLPPLIAFILSIGLALLIWRTSPQKQLSIRLFIALLITISAWGLILFGMRTSVDIEQALLWDRGVPVAILATFVLFHHFTHAYTYSRGQRGILIASYVGLAITAAISPTGLIIERMRVEDYGYAPVIGPGAYPVLLSYPLLTAAAIRNLVRRYKISPLHEEKSRLVYLIIGAGLLLTGVFLDALSNLPPACIKTNIAFSILGSIAILKYNLLDIRTIARRSLTYIVASGAIAIPYVAGMFYLTHTLGVATSPIWIHAIIIVLIAILIRPLYTWSQQRVDRLFYRGRYDYLKALQEFGRRTQSITNLKQLCSNVVRLVIGALQTSCAYLLLPSSDKKGFIMERSTGPNNLTSKTILKNNSAIINWLKRHPDILSYEEFDIRPELQNLSVTEREIIEKLGARLFVPIKTKERQLSGLLILGGKLSRQPFSTEEKQLLEALSSQVAMAISNALLYEEVKQSEQALRESEEKLRLTFDSMAEGIAVTDLGANIVEVNKALLRMFGYKCKDELIGRSAFEFMTERDRSDAQKNMERMAKGEYIVSGESTLLKKDGKEFNAGISAATIRDPASGTSTGSVTIIEDITERKHVEEQIEKSRKQLRALYVRLNSVREEERKLIACEIHDELGQSLTALKMDLFSLHKGLPKAQEKLIRKIDTMMNLINDTMQAVKRISSALRPGILDDLGIVAAIEWETKEFQERTRVKCKLELMSEDVKVDSQIATTIYRILQEALTNVSRHADATQVDVSLNREDNNITLKVEDNGRGITEEQISDTQSLGLLGMKERASFHGGEVKIQGIQGKGTTLIVSIPLERKGNTQ